MRRQHNSQDIHITELADVGAARRTAMRVGRDADMPADRVARLGLVVTEMGTNLVHHTAGGRIVISPSPHPEGVDVWSIDRGPGLDGRISWTDGYSTRGTQGVGLGAIVRLSDGFSHISSRKGTILYSHFGPDVPTCIVVQLHAHGETSCGDAVRVRVDGRTIRVAVADGLGHGQRAGHAADVAVDALTAAGPPNTAMLRVATALADRDYLGASAGVATVGPSFYAISTIGDTRAALVAQGQPSVLEATRGRLGRHLEDPVVHHASRSPHAHVVLATDGVRLESLRPHPTCSMGVLAGLLLRDHHTASDDATMILIRSSAG